MSEKWNKVLAKGLVSHSLADFIVCTTRARRNKLVLTLVCSLLFSVSLSVLRDVYSWFSELKCTVFCEILDVVSMTPRPSFPACAAQTCIIWNLIIALA